MSAQPAEHGEEAPAVGAQEVLVADDHHAVARPRAADVVALGIDVV
jgi:hypothetical protein